MRFKFFVMFATVAFLVLASQNARAQSDAKGVEVGAQFSALWLRDLNIPDPARGLFTTRTFNKTVAGFGGRLTYNINGKIAIDSELNFFPEDDLDSSGRKLQGLLGVKAGSRSDSFGLFFKLRPGFFYSKRALDCPNGDISRCGTSGVTDLALDVGGVVEFYPSSRTSLRFDLGDTLIFHRERNFVIAIPEPGGPVGRIIPLAGDATHNLQFSVGIGIRF